MNLHSLHSQSEARANTSSTTKQSKRIRKTNKTQEEYVHHIVFNQLCEAASSVFSALSSAESNANCAMLTCVMRS